MFASSPVSQILQRRLIFVSGKGGVGKTTVSEALAHALAEQKKKTLWVLFEDPTRPLGETMPLSKNLWVLNCEATIAFEEYVQLKIGIATLAKIFLQNKLVRYLAKAAPGIHELVLLGKIWYERQNYDHIVLDMPSTGYGLAMFHSVENFFKLFHGGPIHHDAEAMLETFRNPKETGQLIISLPEEMPLQESLELGQYLLTLFPKNPPAFLVNRLFPPIPDELKKSLGPPHSWPSPLPTSALDYAARRSHLESYNLKLWENLIFDTLPYIPPPIEKTAMTILHELTHIFKTQYPD